MKSGNEKLRDPRLVQRIKFGIDGKLEFDYMGNSEFEFGRIWRARKELIDSGDVFIGEFVVTDSKNLLIDSGTKVEFLCKKGQENEVRQQILQLLNDELNPIEGTQVTYPTSDHNQNYWCLDQGYFFSLNGNLQNFIGWLQEPSVRERTQIFSTRAFEVVQNQSDKEVDTVEENGEFIPKNEQDIRDFIAEIYLPGTTRYAHLTKNKHLHKPTHKAINFSNNLANFGLRTKELNVYVNPNEYKRAQNEVLIWSPENNGASVYITPFSIKGDVPCFNLETITGVVTLSSSNPDKSEYALDRYFIEQACRAILGTEAPKNHLIYVAIDYMSNPQLISFFEEKTWKAMKAFLKKNNIQKILSDYLKQVFSKQKTPAEYEQLAKEASDLLHVRIKFFEFVLEKFGKEKSFEDKIKRLVRVWYKNRDVLEKIRTLEEMIKILNELFPEEQIDAFIRNTNMRVRSILEQ